MIPFSEFITPDDCVMMSSTDKVRKTRERKNIYNREIELQGENEDS